MRITKLGHCCLVVEITPLPAAPTTPPRGLGTPPRAGGDGGTPLVRGDKPVRIMTDPGAWSTRQNEEKGIDYIFITHEHQDHFHIESLKKVLANNPKAKVITNKGVGKLLDVEHIPYELLEHGSSMELSLNRPRGAVGRTPDGTSSRGVLGGVRVEGHGEKHAVIYKEFGQVQNTGYFFADRLF